MALLSREHATHDEAGGVSDHSQHARHQHAAHHHGATHAPSVPGPAGAGSPVSQVDDPPSAAAHQPVSPSTVVVALDAPLSRRVDLRSEASVAATATHPDP